MRLVLTLWLNRHCLGDAVHRHPPNHGLGSNTCIQDAHNLAWKVAYVHKGINELESSRSCAAADSDSGLASPRILDSYSEERQPVGLDVVTMYDTYPQLRPRKGIRARD